MKRLAPALLAALLLGSACGAADDPTPAGAVDRTVLVDYRHDEFASAFLRYYPAKVTVRPGDTVKFRQTWTGEAHSVTMGRVVDDLFGFSELMEKYDSAEDALAGGETQETIDRVLGTISRVPGMVGDGDEIFQPGAQPCYVADLADVPLFSDPRTESTLADAKCPTAGQAQPPFRGTEGLYNSGFIPYEGQKGNTFDLPVADDAVPGTYKYFCNFHWISMSGDVEVVAGDAAIPSQNEVNRQARKEIQADAAGALAAVRKAEKGDLGEASAPVAGLSTGEDDHSPPAIVNEFYPGDVEAKVGEPVTWTVQGAYHTVSFNVPKYFPIFTVADDGAVTWEPESKDPVGWEVPEPPPGPPDQEQDLKVDVGTWDGSGGFHSSGALGAGSTFTVTFSAPGTYDYACVLHPPMVGKVVVRS